MQNYLLCKPSFFLEDTNSESDRISGKCRISDLKKLSSLISEWVLDIRCYILSGYPVSGNFRNRCIPSFYHVISLRVSLEIVELSSGNHDLLIVYVMNSIICSRICTVITLYCNNFFIIYSVICTVTIFFYLYCMEVIIR